MPSFNLEEMLIKAVLVGTRLGFLLIFSPFLGGEALPARVKAGFILGLTVLLYPVCAPAIPVIAGPNLVPVLLHEGVVGLGLGLTAQFVTEAAQLAGQLAGFQIGFSLVNIIDPFTAVDTPVLAILHRWIALLIFLELNVHHWLLRAVVRSFSYLPPEARLLPLSSVSELLHAAGGVWLAGVQIAAPLLAATFLLDIALGFLSKASPQMPVLFFGLSLKLLLGLSVLMVALKTWPMMFEKQFSVAIAAGERWLHLAH